MNKVQLTDDIVITEENILGLGKAIALKALKGSLRYAYGSLDYLYQNMINELYRRNEGDIYSDAYDIVQETVCFLCNFIGQRLGEQCGKITIRLACFKTIYAFIRKQIKVNNNEMNDELLPYVPAKETPDKEPTDYTRAKIIVNTVVQTPLEMQILSYYYSGVQPKNIAEFLGVGIDAVYKRHRKFKNRWLNFIG